MASVRSLTSEKLRLYFKNLESENLNSSTPGLLKICALNSSQNSHCPNAEFLKGLKENSFKPFGSYSFVLSKGTKIFVFSHDGISKLLFEREGLGETGEIYLVGKDQHIKSASRFLKNWDQINVNNDSVRKGFLNTKGVEIVKDYRDIKVVSAFDHFIQDELEFVILSEIDWEEVTRPLNNLIVDLAFIGGILFLLSLGLAFLLTRSTLSLIERMKKEILKLNAESGIKVIEAQEVEREKIAYDLHDSVGQYVTALNWELHQIEGETTDSNLKSWLGKISRIGENIIREIKAISRDITPPLIRDFGSFLAIKHYLFTQQENFPIKFDYHFTEELTKYELPHAFSMNIYRMVQELVQNTIKHSKATHVELSFDKLESKMRLKYQDNGIGMLDDSPMPRSLEYRARLFEGQMRRSYEDGKLQFIIIFDLEKITNGTN